MKISYWDLYHDFKSLQEKRKNVFELVLTAEDVSIDASKQYYEHEKAYGTMPEDDWYSKERDLADEMDGADEDLHKLQEILDAIDEAIELLPKLEDCYRYLEEEAGIK